MSIVKLRLHFERYFSFAKDKIYTQSSTWNHNVELRAFSILYLFRTLFLFFIALISIVCVYAKSNTLPKCVCLCVYIYRTQFLCVLNFPQRLQYLNFLFLNNKSVVRKRRVLIRYSSLNNNNYGSINRARACVFILVEKSLQMNCRAAFEMKLRIFLRERERENKRLFLLLNEIIRIVIWNEQKLFIVGKLKHPHIITNLL